MNDAQKAEQRHAEALDLCERYIKLLHKAEAERDEARAEVKRLKAQMEVEAKDYTQDDVNRMTDEMIALRKGYEKAAYQRGAEAMREAAVRCIEARHGEKAAERIRALPVPEGK